MSVYVGQQIDIHPPVPSNDAFMASLNATAAQDDTVQSLWIRTNEDGQGVAIVCHDPNGYAFDDQNGLKDEVNQIVAGLGAGYTYTEYLYVEVEEDGLDGLYRIHVRNGKGYVEPGGVVFDSDGNDTLTALYRAARDADLTVLDELAIRAGFLSRHTCGTTNPVTATHCESCGIELSAAAPGGVPLETPAPPAHPPIPHLDADGKPLDLLSKLLVKYLGPKLALDAEADWQLSRDDQFLLIEKSTRDGTYWLSGFESLADAAVHRDSQEYPEDWEVIGLVDVVYGVRYMPSTGWQLSDPIDL